MHRMSFHVKTHGLFGEHLYHKNAFFFEEGKNTMKGKENYV